MIQVAQRNFRKYIVHRDWPWFVIIQKTRPLIGLPNPEEELRVLEEKATKAYGSYMEQLDTKAQLEGENTSLSAELDQMRQQIFAEQGDLGQYQERMAKASAQKADLEVQLEESRNKLQVGTVAAAAVRQTKFNHRNEAHNSLRPASGKGHLPSRARNQARGKWASSSKTAPKFSPDWKRPATREASSTKFSGDSMTRSNIRMRLFPS